LRGTGNPAAAVSLRYDGDALRAHDQILNEMQLIGVDRGRIQVGQGVGAAAVSPRLSNIRSWASVGWGDMSLPLRTRTDGFGLGAIDPLAELAHDLRQPIATIRALIASLKAVELSPDALRWHLDNMDGQVDDLADLVRALLATLVASPDAGAVEAVRPVEVNSSVAEVVRWFAVTWPGRITTAFGEEAILPAPPQMFRRSVRNILDNAARAAGNHGAIRVSVVNSVTGTSIAIEDDGPGFGALPAEHAIGLKIVGRTMSQAGGSLEITTSGVLGGACVALSFPPTRDEVSIG
jgi:K+-sensing histidine kinase KdpD